MTSVLQRTSCASTRVVTTGCPLARRAVVVHAGARDSYQLALGLAEAGLLETLAPDFFCSTDEISAKLLPASVRRRLMLRSAPGLSSSKVKQLIWSGLGGLLLDKASFLPYEFRRWLTRRADARLGSKAGRLARSRGCYLVSYSYYGFKAFRTLGRPDMLFQMHPHPATMRRLLLAEMGVLARRPAEMFTWQRFRLSVAKAVSDFMITDETKARAN